MPHCYLIPGDIIAEIQVLKSWAEKAEARGNLRMAAEWRKQALDLLIPYGGHQ